MNRSDLFRVPALVLASASAAVAMVKPPSLGGAMKHVDLMFDGAAMSAHIDESVAMPLLVDLRAGADYTDQYAVLNGTIHNAQYGWTPGGLFDVPAGTGIWVRLIDQSPGLRAYDGRGSLMAGTQTMTPILGTDGSGEAWRWLGSMTHNWHAIDPALAAPGAVLHADYQVYLGDAITGAPATAFTAADVRLEWRVIPEPASLGVAGLAIAGLARRRRRR